MYRDAGLERPTLLTSITHERDKARKRDGNLKVERSDPAELRPHLPPNAANP
jgi:hypothetical protein